MTDLEYRASLARLGQVILFIFVGGPVLLAYWLSDLRHGALRNPTSLETGRILEDPLADRILSSMFDPHAAIDETGAVGRNRDGFDTIRLQGEAAYGALALAIVDDDRTLYDSGIRALEFGLSDHHVDGTIRAAPIQDRFRFAVFGIRAYTLARRSPNAGAYARRLDTIRSGLTETTRHVASDLPAHPEVHATANQIAWLAYALIATGEMSDDESLRSQGTDLLHEVLEMQRRDGVFPELGGHDSHYQAVTLLALANVLFHSDDVVERIATLQAISAGYEWLETRISETGSIDDTGNTRTANDPSASPEGKRIDPREVGLALLYVSHLTADLAPARRLAARVVGSA